MWERRPMSTALAFCLLTRSVKVPRPRPGAPRIAQFFYASSSLFICVVFFSGGDVWAEEGDLAC